MNIETYLDPPPLLRYIGNYIDLDWLWQHRVSPQLRTEVHHNFFSLELETNRTRKEVLNIRKLVRIAYYKLQKK